MMTPTRLTAAARKPPEMQISQAAAGIWQNLRFYFCPLLHEK